MAGESEDRRGTLRVLIVEDNEAAAQTTGWMVEMMGYDYRLANAATAALDLAADYAPQVVLLDIGLPGMNGFDLCRELRLLPGLGDATFIAQTGWTQAHFREMAIEAGFSQYLVKPLAYDNLNALLVLVDEARNDTGG